MLAEGLAHTYRTYQSFPQFNHPPLMGLYAAQVWQWSHGSIWEFARWIKLPGLAGEALVMWAMRRFGGALAVFRGFSGGRPLGMGLRSVHRRSVLDVPRILDAAPILARGLYSVSRNCPGHDGMGGFGALHMGTHPHRRLRGACPSAG